MCQKNPSLVAWKPFVRTLVFYAFHFHSTFYAQFFFYHIVRDKKSFLNVNPHSFVTHRGWLNFNASSKETALSGHMEGAKKLF